MAKHKVSELEGALLDGAVAKAEGFELDSDGDNMTIREVGGAPSRWRPSTVWEQAGPIIERERIALSPGRNDAEWWARVPHRPGQMPQDYRACSPIVSAMRAYVASKFGQEVELP